MYSMNNSINYLCFRIHKRFFDADFVRNNVHRGRERCVDLAHACSNLYAVLRKNRAKSSSFSSRMPIDAAAAFDCCHLTQYASCNSFIIKIGTLCNAEQTDIYSRLKNSLDFFIMRLCYFLITETN